MIINKKLGVEKENCQDPLNKRTGILESPTGAERMNAFRGVRWLDTLTTKLQGGSGVLPRKIISKVSNVLLIKEHLERGCKSELKELNFKGFV